MRKGLRITNAVWSFGNFSSRFVALYARWRAVQFVGQTLIEKPNAGDDALEKVLEGTSSFFERMGKKSRFVPPLKFFPPCDDTLPSSNSRATPPMRLRS